MHPGAYPGALRDLLGLWIDEFHPLAAGESVAVGPDASHRATVWSESVVPTGAAAVWRFATGPDTGSPALTRHQVGRGTAFTVWLPHAAAYGVGKTSTARTFTFARGCDSMSGQAPDIDV